MTNLILFDVNKYMDNLSFQSRIRLINRNEFRALMSREFASVDYPWTIKQTVYSQKVRTDGIYDCTAMAVKDKSNVLLFHICPTNNTNSNFKKLETEIIQKIIKTFNLDCLQGFILGSKEYNINSPRSLELFDMMEGVLKKLHIQYSKFKGGNYTNDIAYDSKKDEWVIGCDMLDLLSTPKEKNFDTPQNALSRIFDQVKLANSDRLSW